MNQFFNILKQVENTKKWLQLAKETSINSRCLKVQVGAIIVKEGRVIGIGYNDAEPKKNYCPRLSSKSGENYFFCSTHCDQMHHAETMAISRCKEDPKGADLYLYGHNILCNDCMKALKHYGIKNIFIKRNDNTRAFKMKI